jgi:mono/diheme cytochrome c family protein
MSTRLNSRPATAAALLVLVFGAVAGAQQKPTVKHVPARPINSLEGVDTFKEYCAVCHGADARGGGPAAPALKVAPADLTRIAQRRKGEFPREDVRATIVGERVLPAHGTTEMPMWGNVFRSFGSGLDDTTHKLRIQNLVKYLESIQVK